MMRRARKLVMIAVLAQFGIAPALCARVFASVAINGTFNSLETGLGTAIQLDGAAALGTFRGGVLQWIQNGPSNSYAPTSLWNGTGFSSTNFISVGVGMTLDLAYGAHATYQPRAVASQVGPAAAAYIAELWYNHMHELAGLNGGSLTKKVFQDPRRIFIGAFQIAVWKLVADQGLNFNLASGRLRADSGRDAQLAQSWLYQLQAEGTGGPQANLLALTSVGLQSIQIVEGAPGVAPLAVPLIVTAPEPATIVMWGLFAAIGVALRRHHHLTNFKRDVRRLPK